MRSFVLTVLRLLFFSSMLKCILLVLFWPSRVRQNVFSIIIWCLNYRCVHTRVSVRPCVGANVCACARMCLRVCVRMCWWGGQSAVVWPRPLRQRYWRRSGACPDGTFSVRIAGCWCVDWSCCSKITYLTLQNRAKL